MTSPPAVLEAQEIEFYGDAVFAVEDVATGRVFVPIGPLCDNLGIARWRQTQRIQEHQVLSKGVITRTVQTSGGLQETLCLRLDLIPFWLAGVNANRVRAEVRDKLILYQSEVAAVLWDAFRPAGQPSSAALTSSGGLSPAAQAYETAMAVANLARQQMQMESQLVGLATTITEHSDRLAALELTLAPQHAITSAQATELSQAIKTVALALGERTGRNEYGGVYGQLYREFGITSYRELPADRFPDAMEWLRTWFRAIRRGIQPDQADESTGGLT